MMKRNLFFALSTIVVLSLSCQKQNRWDCIKRTGEKTTETRILSPFTKLLLYDNIDLYITQGATQEIKIEGGKNLVSLIKTEVVNDALKIRNENKCAWARSYKKGVIAVHITIPTLNSIDHNGFGTIYSNDTVFCDQLRILASETGNLNLTISSSQTYIQCLSNSDVTIKGKTDILGIYHTGQGYLYLNDFIADYVYTDTYANGNQYVRADIEISSGIYWLGDIYYSGKASNVSRKGDGKGQLIHKN